MIPICLPWRQKRPCLRPSKTMRLVGTLAVGALLWGACSVDSVELGLGGEDVIRLEFALSSGVWSDDQNDASWGGDSFVGALGEAPSPSGGASRRARGGAHYHARKLSQTPAPTSSSSSSSSSSSGSSFSTAWSRSVDYVETCSGPQTYEEVFSKGVKHAGYQADMRPATYYGNMTAPPDVVRLQFFVTEIAKITAESQTMTTNGYIIYKWEDPRLAFNGTDAGGCFDAVFATNAERSDIWR